MISGFFGRLWGALPFVFTRKRALSYRDSSDDEDDMDIEVMVTSPKRPRMESMWTVSDFPSLQRPLEPRNNGADWIPKSKRRFSQTFFTREEPKQAGTQTRSQPSFQEIITIDDDDEGPEILPEIVVVPSDSSNGQGDPKSQLLNRPPLLRRSIPEPCAKSRSVMENAALTSVRKKTNIENGIRQSENRNSSQKSTPIKHRHCYVKPGVFKSGRIYDLTDRENRPFGTRVSTAEKSVRLDERERYAEILNFYSSNSSTHLAGSVWPLCAQKQVAIGDSRKENIVTKRKSPVSKQKLVNSFVDDLKQRLCPGSAKAEVTSVLKPVQDASEEIVWLSTSYGSSGVKFIERKISPSKSKLKLKARPVTQEIEVITLPEKRSEGLKKLVTEPGEPMAGPKEPTVKCKDPKPVSKDSEISVLKSCKLQENPLLESVYTKDTWLSNVVSRFQCQDAEWNKQIENAEAELARHRKQMDAVLAEKMKNVLRLQEIKLQEEDEEVQEIDKLVELTPEMLNKIKEALRPTPPNEVLVEAFNLKITRRDMETLNRDNWLNDEVINFYFTLLYERGKLDNYPLVHVCNTFFYPKLISNGHASLKRWTRKTDIFAHDLMLVPVHLGVHWCLAVVDFRCKKIQYYDSMSGKNQQCLNALKGYLEAESLDKKKVKLDTSGWSLEIVKEKPNQLNGSDCGMFTCKYAEYISRDAKITFTQEDMPYFRRRMVYEILTARLL